MLLAFEVSAQAIVSFFLGALGVGGAAISIYDKRKRELTQTYKDLYEAKSAEVEVLQDKVTRLEARVDFFESGFTKGLAKGVVDAIYQILEQDRPDRH